MRRDPPGRPAPPLAWPAVTVQLPVYDERLVVERSIAAAAALDYPAGLLEIQVLDDSTDDTCALAAAAVARHRARGVNIVHLRRAGRAGFKAGALAGGLSCASGELVAIFDADFVPPADFLRRTVPHFADPRVGLVQARWGHLNRDRSALTTAQAVLLDAHFLLEHGSRSAGGLYFNFNGTAGVWRRACIEAAGGWSHDTLTEDLDLSYRAQLAGWRFVFVRDVVAPAELPGDMEALRSQQRRWAKGSIQTARKLLPNLLASPLPPRVKLEAVLHLTANAAYPLLLALALLLLPVLVVTTGASPPVTWALQAGTVLLGVLPVGLFLAAGQAASGGRGARIAWDVAAALVLGVGLSVNNARAVLEGLGPRLGEWERTPKSGERDGGPAPAARARYTPAGAAAGWGELALALYSAVLAAFALGMRDYRALPFALLLVAGFGAVGAGSLRARLAARARPAATGG
ncbi:MAG: glycosyltransferase [Candidatus Eisenbacteria bacterium]|nr:glycosyltransferase [Candidatus Eisenbacteria bacterium]